MTSTKQWIVYRQVCVLCWCILHWWTKQQVTVCEQSKSRSVYFSVQHGFFWWTVLNAEQLASTAVFWRKYESNWRKRKCFYGYLIPPLCGNKFVCSAKGIAKSVPCRKLQIWISFFYCWQCYFPRLLTEHNQFTFKKIVFWIVSCQRTNVQFDIWFVAGRASGGKIPTCRIFVPISVVATPGSGKRRKRKKKKQLYSLKVWFDVIVESNGVSSDMESDLCGKKNWTHSILFHYYIYFLFSRKYYITHTCSEKALANAAIQSTSLCH